MYRLGACLLLLFPAFTFAKTPAEVFSMASPSVVGGARPGRAGRGDQLWQRRGHCAGQSLPTATSPMTVRAWK